jgi:3,4-dihydroxy 2-butanone 4-phosphate synthase / GTP cyclohydrolase II
MGASMTTSIEQALAHFRAGGMLVVVDDESRENEGDLVIAAQKVTPAAVTFMARQGGGLICLAMTGEQLDRLGIPLMVPENQNEESLRTAFTASIEAATGVTTGISAADRARTILVASSPVSSAVDVTTPGHIFPLRARAGGLLERQGHTEAAVDLARLAGLWPAGVICEIMADDGTMMRLPELRRFARDHNLPLVSVAQLLAYRRSLEGVASRTMCAEPADHIAIQPVASSKLPTPYGVWNMHAFLDDAGREHLALVMGQVADDPPVLARLHSECLTGDALGSLRCDCGEQLAEAMRRIGNEGHGLLLYLRQEGRGIGLINKVRAYALQDDGLDTVEANHRLGFPADGRDYTTAAAMLHQLGVRHIRLLTNNPHKVEALERLGISVRNQVPLEVPHGSYNERYLNTKRHKLGHLLHLYRDR